MTVDRPKEQADLAQADRHVAEAEARIGRQRDLLARARETGDPQHVARAEGLLAAMETGLTAMREHQAAIVRALEED